ncbi:MAG TPA: NUDIX domain-containing protein [Candidatus Paceibacterota bacterium]
MKTDKQRPLPAVGVMIWKKGKVLIGQRKGESSHAVGTWCFPGGKLEYGETLEKCVLREVKEECGVKVKNIKFQCVANIKKYDKHHVLIGFTADWQSGEPKNLEPHKTADWQWVSLNNLPGPLFEASRLMIVSYNTNKRYFDA